MNVSQCTARKQVNYINIKSMWNDLQSPLQLLILDGVVERLQRKIRKTHFQANMTNSRYVQPPSNGNLITYSRARLGSYIVVFCESCSVNKLASFNKLCSEKCHPFYRCSNCPLPELNSFSLPNNPSIIQWVNKQTISYKAISRQAPGLSIGETGKQSANK